MAEAITFIILVGTLIFLAILPPMFYDLKSNGPKFSSNRLIQHFLNSLRGKLWVRSKNLPLQHSATNNTHGYKFKCLQQSKLTHRSRVSSAIPVPRLLGNYPLHNIVEV
jgi:hypothetical protein